jgi:hypothetical protein
MPAEGIHVTNQTDIKLGCYDCPNACHLKIRGARVGIHATSFIASRNEIPYTVADTVNLSVNGKVNDPSISNIDYHPDGIGLAGGCVEDDCNFAKAIAAEKEGVVRHLSEISGVVVEVQLNS